MKYSTGTVMLDLLRASANFSHSIDSFKKPLHVCSFSSAKNVSQASQMTIATSRITIARSSRREENAVKEFCVELTSSVCR